MTRNIQYTNVCYFRCGFCAFSKGKLAANLRGAPYLVPFEEIVRRTEEAWERGATEVCLQGGIHPAFTGEYYADVVRAIKRAVPEIHVHAFSALEVWQGAATLGLSLAEYLGHLRDLGLGSLPGTAAESRREVRRVICPDKVTTNQWLAVHDAAHRVGLRSRVTLMFGHADTPRSWARHFLAHASSNSGRAGSPSSSAPFVPMEAPIYLQGRHAVDRPSADPARPRSHGSRSIQIRTSVSWVKLGPEERGEHSRPGERPRRDAHERVDLRSAGAAFPARADGGAHPICGTRSRRRTTLCGDPPAERVRASRRGPLAEPINPPLKDAGLAAAASRPASLIAAPPSA